IRIRIFMIDVVIPYNTMPYDIVKPPSNCCMAPVPIPGAKLFGSREVESAHRLADAADLGSSGSGLLNRRPLRPQDRRRGEKSAQSLLFPTTRPFSTCETLVLYRLFRAVVS